MPRVRTPVCEVHTDDCQCYKQATPAAQSLEELDFLKSACAAAQQGNVQRLQAILDKHPKAIGTSNDSGELVLRLAMRLAMRFAIRCVLHLAMSVYPLYSAQAVAATHHCTMPRGAVTRW